MPPVRTLTAPIKPMKTERTHEENQERAYIAASRRSDRSLEARVESARRASEIHKRRTGRALRVTEQDVVNEEMYEEEDEDLPVQYRRLAMHLNSGAGGGLNGRLAAYLTNHIAMRTALGQAIANSNQSFPNPSNFSTMKNPPWSPSQQQAAMSGTDMSPNTMAQSSYPAQSAQLPHQPANQISTPTAQPQRQSDEETPSNTAQVSVAPRNERRASEPAAAWPHGTLEGQNDPKVKSLSTPPDPNADDWTAAGSGNAGNNKPNSDSTAKSAHFPSPESTQLHPSTPQQMQGWTSSPPSNMGPLSTAMPREVMMFPGMGFSNDDPFGYGFGDALKGSHGPYGFAPTAFSGSNDGNLAFNGMNQTLAPGMLDTDPNNFNWSDGPYSAPPFVQSFDSFWTTGQPTQPSMSDVGEGDGSGTPNADQGWASFIDQSSWD